MPTRKRRIQHAEIVLRFATRLKETRISRGMTQLELARKAHVTASYIWRLESGGASPGIDLVDRLASALGMTVSDLLPETSPPDTYGVLMERAKRLFEALLGKADRETLLMLNPLLARLGESAPRSR